MFLKFVLPLQISTSLWEIAKSSGMVTKQILTSTARKAFCLKAKKTHGFNSCIVISVYQLDIPSIEKVQNISIIDKLTS